MRIYKYNIINKLFDKLEHNMNMNNINANILQLYSSLKDNLGESLTQSLDKSAYQIPIWLTKK